MLKAYLYTYFALALGQANTYAPSNDTYMLCMDCSKTNKVCTIKETGYSVIKPDYSSAKQIRNHYAPMDVCLPAGMQINETEFDACCIWSPKLGCQVVINRFRKVQMFCNDCIPHWEPVDDGRKRCPCLGYKVIESGSGYSHSGPLKILIASYLVQRLILE